MKQKLIILTLLIFTFSVAMADDVKFTASAPGQVIAGRQFQIVYTLQNGDGSDLKTPEFKGMNLLYGPGKSRSSQFSIINGRTTSTTEEIYTYTLTAKEAGTYTIAPATIMASGKQYTSNTLTIKVLPPDSNTQESSSPNTPSAGRAGQGTDDRTFARIILSKTKPYEQEAILATIKIYTKAAGIRSLESATFPSFEGFVVQDIPIQNPQIELEHYSGENYSVVAIKRALLYPQRSGNITIEPGKFEVAVQVIRPVRSLFGIMQGYEDVNKKIQTQSVSVNVKPLPSGKPASYANAVGNFTITSDINTLTPKTNEAVTLKIKIKGKGNLKYIKDPDVEFPADFEVYDPKTDLDTKTTLSGVEGTRTIEYTAIPRSAGEFDIPPVQFAYFDVSSGKYKTLQTEAYRLNVAKGKESSGVQVSDYTTKEQLKMLNEDIRYIKNGEFELQQSPQPFYGTWKYWISYLIPVIIFAAYVAINRKQAKENANVKLMKTRRANKVASKRLKTANKYLKDHNKEMFYSEVLKAVWGYLSDKLMLPVSELNRDNIASELQKYGTSDEVAAMFIEILNICEFAQYAPTQSDEAMDKLYGDTVEAISKMENTKKNNRQ